MDEIAKRRAEKKEDCREWTPLDALEDLVKDIKDGKCKPTQLIVHMFEEHDNGKDHSYVAAGIAIPEHIALLQVAMASVLELWRR